jgi:hypothetical protein
MQNQNLIITKNFHKMKLKIKLKKEEKYLENAIIKRKKKTINTNLKVSNKKKIVMIQWKEILRRKKKNSK